MRNTKKIWRDNTMPPTNYIWMKTNMKNELIGVYEWLNGAWHLIKINDSDTYTKSEIDLLLQATETEIIRKIISGEYDITGLTIDSELSDTSKNAVENRVITAALNKKLDKQEFYDSAILQEDFPWNN